MGFHSQSESTKQKLWMLLSTSLFCSCDKKLRLSPMSPVDICSWMVTFLFLLDNTIKNHFLICKVNSIDEVLNCYCLYMDMAYKFQLHAILIFRKKNSHLLPTYALLPLFEFCTLVLDAWYRQMTFILQTEVRLLTFSRDWTVAPK